MATLQFPLVRAEDGLVLDVRLIDLTPQPAGDGWVLPRPAVDGGAAITVTFPFQHVLEIGKKADGTRVAQERAIFGTTTEVTFLVPKAGGPIPLTVEGLLTALGSMPLHVDPAAKLVGPASTPAGVIADARPGGGVLAERQRRAAALALAGGDAIETDGAGVVDPAPSLVLASLTTSRVNVPSRLRLLIPGGWTRFTHRTRPVVADDVVELWHSRFTVAAADPAVPPAELRLPVPVRDVPTNSAGAGDTRAAQIAAADATTVPKAVDAIDIETQTVTNGQPLRMRGLLLSPAGGSAELDGSFGSGSTISYQHRVVLGRDEKARTSVRGQLYPFGHAAVLSTSVQRIPDGNNNGSIAGLVSSSILVVREPVAEYGDGDGDPDDRAWPWQRIEILDTVSPPGDAVPAGTASWLRVGGVPYALSCVATDRAGHVIRFTLPMLFVPQGAAIVGLPAVLAGLGPSFTRLQLGSQPVALAPPAGGDAAADGTTILANTADLVAAPVPFSFRPKITSYTGVVPVVDGIAPGDVSTIRYAGRYLAAGFNPLPVNNVPGNPGELLMEFTGPVATLGKEVAALFSPSFTVTGVSRRLGAVAGPLSAIADARFRPDQWLDATLGSTKLLGVFPLLDLLPPDLTFDQAPKQVTEVIDGLTSYVTTWDTDLLAPGESYVFDSAVLSAADQPVHLSLTVTTSADRTTGEIRSHAHTEITGAVLGLGLGGAPVVTLPLPEVSMDVISGSPPTVDVKVGIVGFHGPLSFVGALAGLLRDAGLGQGARGDGSRAAPPSGTAIEVLDGGVRGSLALAVPDLAIGMFSLSDLAFRTTVDLFFDGRPPVLAMNFATFDNPFRLTVSALGGGGHFAVRVSTQKLELLAGSLDFGAQVKINLGVAEASVSITGGVLLEIVDSLVHLAGFLRIRGELDVLGLISVCVELTLTVEYVETQPDRGKLRGEAELAIKVKVLFFSKTVKVKFSKEFTGSNGDPSFAELMAPAGLPGPRPWDVYCTAFAA